MSGHQHREPIEDQRADRGVGSDHGRDPEAPARANPCGAPSSQGQDILLYSAALALSVILGDQRTHQLAQEIRRVAPENIGADQALIRVANLGSKLGIVSMLTALWPATAYGSGLERAFDRLGPNSRPHDCPGARSWWPP